MSEPRRDFRSPLNRVRGLGSAKDGVHHWWVQRLTAVALVPLCIWFVASLVAHTGASYAATRDWLREPLTVGLLLLLIGIVFHHAQLGLQVVIEDYVHREGAKIVLIILLKGAALVLALAGILAVLFTAFGG